MKSTTRRVAKRGLRRSDPDVSPQDAGRTDAVAGRDLAQVVRREFFGRAGQIAARYGVSPEFVIDHCESRRPGSPLHVAKMIAYLEDITHVVGCVHGSPVAWADLLEMHEPSLIRVCRDCLSEPDSIMHVRRWMRLLRRETTRLASDESAPSDYTTPSLREYNGLRPLRHWLGERLVAELLLGPGPHATSGGGGSPAGRLTPKLRLTRDVFSLGFASQLERDSISRSGSVRGEKSSPGACAGT